MPRDSSITADLRECLEQRLELTPPAVAYLCALFDTIQGLDDWFDGDDTPDKAGTIWNAVGGLQLQPFFMQHAALLLPLQVNAYLKWMGANHTEREGGNLPLAYAWRAGFYDIVLQCVLLVHGIERATQLAPEVMAIYGESFEDYAKEFENA